MTEQKKLTRRDAIKLIGAAAGASVLANIPAKWSKPSLAGGIIPAHAQTSHCGPGTSSMLVELFDIVPPVSGGQSWSGEWVETGEIFTDGYKLFYPCQTGCFDFSFSVSTSATIRITLNGIVVAEWYYTGGESHSIAVLGATGEYVLDLQMGDPYPWSCDLKKNQMRKEIS